MVSFTQNMAIVFVQQKTIICWIQHFSWKVWRFIAFYLWKIVSFFCVFLYVHTKTVNVINQCFVFQFREKLQNFFFIFSTINVLAFVSSRRFFFWFLFPHLFCFPEICLIIQFIDEPKTLLFFLPLSSIHLLFKNLNCSVGKVFAVDVIFTYLYFFVCVCEMFCLKNHSLLNKLIIYGKWK